MVFVSLHTISPSQGCMYSPASTTSAQQTRQLHTHEQQAAGQSALSKPPQLRSCPPLPVAAPFTHARAGPRAAG